MILINTLTPYIIVVVVFAITIRNIKKLREMKREDLQIEELKKRQKVEWEEQEKRMRAFERLTYFKNDSKIMEVVWREICPMLHQWKDEAETTVLGNTDVLFRHISCERSSIYIHGVSLKLRDLGFVDFQGEELGYFSAALEEKISETLPLLYVRRQNNSIMLNFSSYAKNSGEKKFYFQFH